MIGYQLGMKTLIDRLLNAARKYTVWDFGFFKILLLSAGILLGAYFHEFFDGWIAVVWAVFVITYAWVAYKTFFRYLDRR